MPAFANTNTAAAQDAHVIIAVKKWIVFLHRQHPVADGINRLPGNVFFSQGLQLTLAILGAGSAPGSHARFAQGDHAFIATLAFQAVEARGRVFCEEHLQQFRPQSLYFGAVGQNIHPLFHRRGAGSRSILAPLDLDDAHAAASGGWQTREVTQRGNFDPVLACSLQNGEAFSDVQRPAIDMNHKPVVSAHTVASLWRISSR